MYNLACKSKLSRVTIFKKKYSISRCYFYAIFFFEALLLFNIVRHSDFRSSYFIRLFYLSFLSGVILPMVLCCGRAGMLRGTRPGHWRFNPLRAEITARVCDLGWQAAHPGRLQGAILRGRSSLHRRDRARAKGKASAPLAHAGKSRLGTDGRFTACLLFKCGESAQSRDNLKLK